MTEEQENMIKAKLAEIAADIPAFRGAIVAISAGNASEEGNVTVFKSAGSKEMVNLFDNIAAQVAIAIAMATTPEKVVGLIRRYGDAAPLVLTYGFLTTVRAGLSKVLDTADLVSTADHLLQPCRQERRDRLEYPRSYSHGR